MMRVPSDNTSPPTNTLSVMIQLFFISIGVCIGRRSIRVPSDMDNRHSNSRSTEFVYRACSSQACVNIQSTSYYDVWQRLLVFDVCPYLHFTTSTRTTFCNVDQLNSKKNKIKRVLVLVCWLHSTQIVF